MNTKLLPLPLSLPLFLFLFLGLFLLSVTTFAGSEGGGMDSGGGDARDPYTGNAWFIADRAVYYCAVVDKDFVISKDEVERLITGALSTWFDEIQAIDWPFSEKRGYPKLSTDFHYMNECRSNGRFADLTFYFGGTPNDISSDIAKASPSLVAFTQVKSFQADHTWSKGYIYVHNSNIKRAMHCEEETDFDRPIYPDWSYADNGNLTAILLHELGHVFGVSHIPNTIMRENLAWYLICDGSDTNRNQKSTIKVSDWRETISHEYDITPNFVDREIAHFPAARNNQSIYLQIFDWKYYSSTSPTMKIYFQSNSPPTSSTSSAQFIAQDGSWYWNGNPTFDSSMGALTYVFKKMTRNMFTDARNIYRPIVFENMMLNGILLMDNNTYPAIYTKNIGSTAHRIQYFNPDTKAWETIFEPSGTHIRP